MVSIFNMIILNVIKIQHVCFWVTDFTLPLMIVSDLEHTLIKIKVFTLHLLGM